MATQSKNSAYGNTSSKAARQPEKERYINFKRQLEDGSYTKLGSFMLHMDNTFELPVITAIDAGGENKLASFIEKILVGKFNSGTGDNAGTHYINIFMRSSEGGEKEVGSLRLNESNPKHLPIISELLKDPTLATSIIHTADAEWRDGTPTERTYDF